MLSWAVLAKLLHIVLAATWVGALVYDWLFNLQRYRRLGGAAGLRGYVEETGKAIPFWAFVGFGTLILGYETARQHFDSANPFDWPGLGASGEYVFASFWMVIAALVMGIAQVPPKAKRIADSGDDPASDGMLRRIHWLGAVEVAVILVVVVLMVGAGVGGY